MTGSVEPRCPECGYPLAVTIKTDHAAGGLQSRVWTCPNFECFWPRQEMPLREIKRRKKAKKELEERGQGASPGLREGFFGPGDNER